MHGHTSIRYLKHQHFLGLKLHPTLQQTVKNIASKLSPTQSHGLANNNMQYMSDANILGSSLVGTKDVY